MTVEKLKDKIIGERKMTLDLIKQKPLFCLIMEEYKDIINISLDSEYFFRYYRKY